MRHLTLVLTLSVLGAQHAKASFDLMYIPSTTDNMVYRYDPVNRVRLGGFSASGVRQVFSGNEQLGSLAISAGSYRYNMFNGQNAGFTAFNATSYDHNFGVVNQATSNVIFTRNLATGTNSAVALAGTSFLSRANRFQGGTIASFSASGTNFTGFIHNADGSSIANFGTQTAVGNATNAIRKFNRDGSESVTMGVWDNAVGTLRILSLTRNTNGSYSYSSGTISSMLLGGSHVSLAPAHNGYYIVGADRTTPTSLTRIYAVDDDGPIGFTYDNWTTNIATGTPSGFTVGMVIAPEPGTIVALGAGVLALLRRRKKS